LFDNLISSLHINWVAILILTFIRIILIESYNYDFQTKYFNNKSMFYIKINHNIAFENCE